MYNTKSELMEIMDFEWFVCVSTSSTIVFIHHSGGMLQTGDTACVGEGRIQEISKLLYKFFLNR